MTAPAIDPPPPGLPGRGQLIESFHTALDTVLRGGEPPSCHDLGPEAARVLRAAAATWPDVPNALVAAAEDAFARRLRDVASGPGEAPGDAGG